MDRRYLLEGTLVVLLILGPSMAVALALDVKQGSIAEWVSALATVAAVIAAVYAGRAAHRALRIELDREEARIQRERLDQASKVAAWFDIREAERPSRHPGLTTVSSYYTVRGARLRNASDVPVTGVTIRFHLDGHGPAPQTVGSLPPAEQPRFVRLEETEGMGWDINSADLEDDVMVDLSFRDGAGQWWTRLGDGRMVNRRNAWEPEPSTAT